MKKQTTTTTSNSNIARPITTEDVYANRKVIIEVGLSREWDYDSCQDLVQEVALKCLRDKPVMFDPAKEALKDLLARIARKTADDICRKNCHTPVPIDDIELVKMLDGQVDYRDEAVE